MNKAIQDGVAEGGISDNFVPMLYGDLAGDDGRGATVAIIKDLEQVAPFGLIKNRETPVIEYQELNAAEGFEQAAIATVAASEGEGLEQAWYAMVLDRAIVAASLVAEGAGNPALAGAGQDSVTMPGVRRSRSGSTIRFILDAGRWCRSRSGGGSQARITWSWFSQTGRSL